MYLPKFEYVRPESLVEVSQILHKYGPEAQVAAGGTDLFPRMKYGLVRPELVVSLKGISPGRPAVNAEGELQLDPLVTLAHMARSHEVHDRAPLFREAALCVGSNQVRHMGTLGGNLCVEPRCLYYNQSHQFQFVEPCFKRGGDQCYLIPKGKRCWAVFAGDTAPALISLAASIDITGAEGERRISLESLYTGDALKPLDLSPGEIITGVCIPAPPPLGGTAFQKITGRGGLDFAALSVAVSLEMNPDGAICKKARVTLGAIAPKPIRAKEAEAVLAEEPLSDGVFQEAARVVTSHVNPVPHHGYSSGYLKYMMEVSVYRSLVRAATELERPLRGSP